MGYGGPLGGIKELARGSRRPRPSLVSRRDLRAGGRCVSDGCGRREKALTRGPGRSVREERERAELAGLLGRLGKREWAGRLGWVVWAAFVSFIFLSFIPFPFLFQT
jgi:hypothetical protein